MFPEGTGLCILISIAAIVSVVTVQHQIILDSIFSLSLCFIKIFNGCELGLKIPLGKLQFSMPNIRHLHYFINFTHDYIDVGSRNVRFGS